MHESRCAAHGDHCGLDRRAFLQAGACLVGSALVAGCGGAALRGGAGPTIRPHGPAAALKPTVRAAFVRRKEPYGMWWPGAIYDGEAARRKYTEVLQTEAERLGVRLDLRPEPIYSTAEADAWIAEAKQARPDGLLVLLLDRQRHAWPTAAKAADSGLPTVIFSPVGTSFTTNTARLAEKPGTVIYATNDTDQLAFGLKMLAARARMRAARCVVLRGRGRKDVPLADLGITLRYVPASAFLEAYRKTPVDAEIEALADSYIRRAIRVAGPTRADVVAGVRSFVVARGFLEREEADAISMDCLGALGRTKVSLPCIAWSWMNDSGVPAACEADTGAIATHIAVQFLFDRPGFQQDPVPETARKAIIGAHCSCPTRLNGFDRPPEPFYLSHHHGGRDAVPRTMWRVGQRVTSADILPGKPSKMLIAAGEVIENVRVPPAGGCVVSVMVRFDGHDTVQKVLTWPGFHQVWFYGDYKDRLVDFCRLTGIEPVLC